MKRATKILNLLTMIFFIFVAITFMIFGMMFSTNFEALCKAIVEKGYASTIEAAKPIALGYVVWTWVFMAIACFPTVVTTLTHYKFKVAESKNQMQLYAILSICSGAFISGIFMLFIPEDEYGPIEIKPKKRRGLFNREK